MKAGGTTNFRVTWSGALGLGLSLVIGVRAVSAARDPRTAIAGDGARAVNSEPSVRAPWTMHAAFEAATGEGRPSPTVLNVPAGSAPAEVAQDGRAGLAGTPFERSEKVVRRATSERTELAFATEPDGSEWVRGRDYKASFGAAGAVFVPFFGSAAPRNYPLTLSLAAAELGGERFELVVPAGARREGARVSIDRGAIDEVYELALDHVEQTFVLNERPGAGDLALRIDVSEDFTIVSDDEGFEFRGEHGSVHYGRAFVRRADGTRSPLESRAVPGGVEILVSADVLARESYPLVIDPVVLVLAAENSSIDHIDGEIAYDVSTDRYMLAYEEAFSAVDGDIVYQLRTAAGAVPYTGYIDVSAENWRYPQVANMNVQDQFLCVAQASNVAGTTTTWVIRGRTLQAALPVLGNKFNISSSDQPGDKTRPDVGGDVFIGSAFYCVTWQSEVSATNANIHARLVLSDSTLVGTSTILVDNGATTLDGWPTISRSNKLGFSQAGSTWTIAWHRVVTPTDYDIYAAQVSIAGVVSTPPFPVVTGNALTYYPRISSSSFDSYHCIVYAVKLGSQHDLYYSVVNGSNALFLDQLPGTNQARDQVEYSVDVGSSRFVVSYAENKASNPSDYDTYVGTYYLDTVTSVTTPQLIAVEPNVPVAVGATSMARTDVFAEWGSGEATSNAFAIAWDEEKTSGSTDHDLYVARYASFLGGPVTSMCLGDGSGGACPCGNTGTTGHGCGNSTNASGAFMSYTGTATPPPWAFAIQGQSMKPNAPALLFQGTTVSSTGITFGDGRRCVTGVIVRFPIQNTNATGFASWPRPGDPPIATQGAVPFAVTERFYQIYYRDAATFCTPSTFNVTSGLRVVWIP